MGRAGGCYLLAWDFERADWRTFRVDRMVPRTPTGPRFTPREVPGSDASAFVAARFRGSDSPDAWPCQGTVILHIPAADVAPFVGGATVEPLGTDRCRVTLGAWSWPAVAASVARFDADVEIVGPRELAEACAALAERLARAASTAAASSTRP